MAGIFKVIDQPKYSKKQFIEVMRILSKLRSRCQETSYNGYQIVSGLLPKPTRVFNMLSTIIKDQLLITIRQGSLKNHLQTITFELYGKGTRTHFISYRQ
jgi:hypothetical protein